MERNEGLQRAEYMDIWGVPREGDFFKSLSELINA